MGTELKRIAYVEDDADIAVMVRLCLVDVAGHELQVFTSGADAAARMGEFAPDLILMDMHLPDMDGIEARRRLGTLPGLATTPVIFLTARADESVAARVRETGGLGLIAKPFDPMALAGQVDALWRRHRAAA